MMKKQSGSTLVIALILLTIITVVAVYSLEGSNIQSKMVANSLFSTLTYQECRNEQEANIRIYNEDGGSKRDELITSMVTATPIQLTDTITESDGNHPPKSDLEIVWTYQREAPAGRSGYNLDSESQSRAYLFENQCNATFSFSQNQQTLGAIVEGLEQAGAIN